MAKPTLLLSMVVALSLVTACGDTTVTDGGDEVGTTTETGGYVDQVPCDPPECVADADCCPTQTAGATFSDMACGVSARYPNRWFCDNEGDCVNQGCDPEAQTPDCITPWDCHEIDAVGYCILTCSVDADCFLYNGNEPNKIECIGETDDSPPVKYCKEPAP